jgi:hypothetical protein
MKLSHFLQQLTIDNLNLLLEEAFGPSMQVTDILEVEPLVRARDEGAIVVVYKVEMACNMSEPDDEDIILERDEVRLILTANGDTVGIDFVQE